MNSCLDCSHHQVIRDPDPDDWFCSDDLAIVCRLTLNPDKDPNSKWVSSRNDFRAITVSCRPHYLKKESDTPPWCPLNLGEKEDGETKEA